MGPGFWGAVVGGVVVVGLPAVDVVLPEDVLPDDEPPVDGPDADGEPGSEAESWELSEAGSVLDPVESLDDPEPVSYTHLSLVLRTLVRQIGLR